MAAFRIAVICVFLLHVQLVTAQRCPTFNQKCNPLSAAKVVNITKEIAGGLAGVNVTMNVESFYDTNPTACLRTRCSISAVKKAQRAAALLLANAFQSAVIDGADVYLESIASGCPTASVRDGWVNVMSLWATAGGFTGNLTAQGEVEVDWRLSAISAGFVKMQPHLTDTTFLALVTGWINTLYGQAILRPNRSDNNHWAWRLTGLIWSAVATARPDLVVAHTSQLIAHMNNKTTIDGIITCERRCTMTAHYHQFYLQAFLTGIAGYKVYFGFLPADYTPELQARALATWALINTFPGGYIAMANYFNYTATVQCPPSNFQRISPSALQVVNALYQYVAGPVDAVASCSAVSPYIGKLRYFKFLTGTIVTPDMSDICCNPFCGVRSVVRNLTQCATKVGR